MHKSLATTLLLSLALYGCGGDVPTSFSARDLGQKPPGEDMTSPGDDLGAGEGSPADMPVAGGDMNDPDQSGGVDMPSEIDPKQPSRCVQTPTEITCDHKTAELDIGFRTREVHYQTPLGQPPEGGWPVVFFFQGSLFSSEGAWTADEDTPYGGFVQAKVLGALLDHGFAVLAPETRVNGSTYWDTNILPYNYNWALAPDHDLMLELFEGIDSGAFGELDGSSLFATGISSGGYMTSRMAVSYPGRFKALAIMAGSYATCAGVNCFVPSLPEEHPPTLFLHGELDAIVPLYTMELYAEDLEDEGVEVDYLLNEDAGHEWIPGAEVAVPEWFNAHR